MSKSEIFFFFGGLVLVWGFPLPFFLLTEAWLLLALYILTNAAFYTTLKFFLCSKCMIFGCPINDVDQAARELFFQRNLSVTQHWLKDKQEKSGRIIP